MQACNESILAGNDLNSACKNRFQANKVHFRQTMTLVRSATVIAGKTRFIAKMKRSVFRKQWPDFNWTGIIATQPGLDAGKSQGISGQQWPLVSCIWPIAIKPWSEFNKQCLIAGPYPPLTRLLPKLHAYSPNQHEYQVCQTACRNIFIFNSSSFTCYTTVFFYP